MAELMRWFPFYVDRFLASARVQQMEASQVGVYLMLLCRQWDKGVVKGTDEDLTLIARAPIEIVRQVLKTCFRKTRAGWVNDALEAVRNDQKAKVEQRSTAGRIGGLVSAQARAGRSQNPTGHNGSERSSSDRQRSSSNRSRREEKRLEESRVKTSKSRATRARGIALPNDWTPNDDHRRIALEQHVDLGTELARFRDWATAKGQVYRDWDAAFRNWLRRAKSLNGNGRFQEQGAPSPSLAMPPAPEPEIDPEERAEIAREAAAMKAQLRPPMPVEVKT